MNFLDQIQSKISSTLAKASQTFEEIRQSNRQYIPQFLNQISTDIFTQEKDVQQLNQQLLVATDKLSQQLQYKTEQIQNVVIQTQQKIQTIINQIQNMQQAANQQGIQTLPLDIQSINAVTNSISDEVEQLIGKVQKDMATHSQSASLIHKGITSLAEDGYQFGAQIPKQPKYAPKYQSDTNKTPLQKQQNQMYSYFKRNQSTMGKQDQQFTNYLYNSKKIKSQFQKYRTDYFKSVS